MKERRAAYAALFQLSRSVMERIMETGKYRIYLLKVDYTLYAQWEEEGIRVSNKPADNTCMKLSQFTEYCPFS